MMKSSGPVDGDVALAVVELNRSVHGGSGVARTVKSFQKAFFTIHAVCFIRAAYKGQNNLISKYNQNLRAS